jgi:hypothetical protein
MSSHLNCPSCKSDATQRLSVIFEHGISDINTSSSTSGIGIGQGGFASTTTRGTSQTAMSQKASPPRKKRFLKPLGLIIFALFVLSLGMGNSKFLNGLVSFLWITSPIGWVAFAINYNSKKWPPLKATWDDSFLCNRCNHIFQISK